MSMNYDDPSRPTPSPTDDEGLMFAPIPSWERGRKRRGFGSAKRPAEPRSFQAADGTTYADTDGDGIAGPIGRTGTTTMTRKSKGAIPAAAVAVGVVALAGLGAAGWYASRDDNRVAELTPGVVETSPVTAPADTTMPAPKTTQMAAAEPARAPARATATTTHRTSVTRTASASRTRTARAASATTTGVNASATLPDGPQPYSSTTTTTTTVTPAPETPAPIPSTPPVSANPAPVNPTTPDPTPPQEPKVEPQPPM